MEKFSIDCLVPFSGFSFNNQTQIEELTEALITFAKQAYPKFGNVVILAGGAGSGKGFVKDKLLGIEGHSFDVDALKSLAMKAPIISAKVKEKFGVDMSKLDLKNPSDVATLHEIIGDELKLDDKKKKALFASIISGDSQRKPNLIFDVTLKDLRKLQSLSRDVKKMGYDNDKIHLVWIVNDIEVAKAQNAKRDRRVPVEILINTHRGASNTLNDIVNMGEEIKTYMDGDIVFAFNKVGVDSEIVKAAKAEPSNTDLAPKDASGGMYIQKANYFYVKRAGQPIDLARLTRDVREKIAAYVPKDANWV